MKMIMIVYNEAIDDEVMETLHGCVLKSYTKITKTFGSGTVSGTHLGNDVWPGLNNILYAACKDDDAKQLFFCIRNLRKVLGKEGVKAFMWELDEVT